MRHWYSLTTGMILNDMDYRDHSIQYTPCSQGSVFGKILPYGQFFLMHFLGWMLCVRILRFNQGRQARWESRMMTFKKMMAKKKCWRRNEWRHLTLFGSESEISESASSCMWSTKNPIWKRSATTKVNLEDNKNENLCLMYITLTGLHGHPSGS